MTKHETIIQIVKPIFVIRILSLIRHWSFVIRHFPVHET
jgi:hypothetical protein